MKQVFSLLLAFVFLQTQTWALGGGPSRGSGSSSDQINGSYAGALLPSSDEDANGLGLFTLTLAAKGLGTGSFVYFSEGKTFTGTVTGLGDPARGTFVGLLKGQFDVIVDSIVITDQVFGNANLTQTEPGGFANGTIKASFKGSGASSTSSVQNTTGVSGLRLTGTAKMEISELSRQTVVDDNGTPANLTDDTTTERASVTTTGSLNLVVDGFQQTVALTTATSLTGQ